MKPPRMNEFGLSAVTPGIAMQVSIRGSGDSYIIPTPTILNLNYFFSPCAFPKKVQRGASYLGIPPFTGI